MKVFTENKKEDGANIPDNLNIPKRLFTWPDKPSKKLKPYFFRVNIRGKALVYAYSFSEAKETINNAGVMVAGNKMREIKLNWTYLHKDNSKN